MPLDIKQLLPVIAGHVNAQIAALTAVSAGIGDEYIDVVQYLMQCSGNIFFIGVGKSGHVAQKLAATMASYGYPAFVLDATHALHGDLGRVRSGDVVILLSYSGRSVELCQLAVVLQRRAVITIAITSQRKSPLAATVQQVLCLPVDCEACPLGVAPTSSSTAMQVIGEAIIAAVVCAQHKQIADFAVNHPAGNLGYRHGCAVGEMMAPLEDCYTIEPHECLQDIWISLRQRQYRWLLCQRETDTWIVAVEALNAVSVDVPIISHMHPVSGVVSADMTIQQAIDAKMPSVGAVYWVDDCHGSRIGLWQVEQVS